MTATNTRISPNPAAQKSARRLETFGARARLQGKILLEESRLRRVVTRHDPAIHPGEEVACV
ncbi:hypothetical protein [Streptomyces sp. NPDC087437]|uniref:hypothetical protein n=1 Tax=Streptomyces sp. NPDC087437 TaxID=3365789 RepID=UPI00380B6A42